MAAACARTGRRGAAGVTPIAEVLTEKGRAVGRGHRGRRCGAGAGGGVQPASATAVRSVIDAGWSRRTSASGSARYQSGSGTFRMNVALSELPNFTCLPGTGDHLTAGIIMAPSLAYMDRAHAEARLNGWSKKPIVEMLIPSTLDDSLAPAGTACGQPVLPACRPGAGRRASRHGRRPDDRDGRSATRRGSRPRWSGGWRSGRGIWSGASAWSAATSSMAADAGSAVQRPAGAGPRASPHAGARPLSVRLRRPSGRRRHRRPGAQCGAGGAEGPRAVGRRPTAHQ
jgi:hypothetical protein